VLAWTDKSSILLLMNSRADYHGGVLFAELRSGESGQVGSSVLEERQRGRERERAKYSTLVPARLRAQEILLADQAPAVLRGNAKRF